MCEIVTGKKWLSGTYKLERKRIIKREKESVKLEIKNGESKLSRSVKHIHYESKKTAIIWFEGSRLGLLYQIVPPSP